MTEYHEARIKSLENNVQALKAMIASLQADFTQLAARKNAAGSKYQVEYEKCLKAEIDVPLTFNSENPSALGTAVATRLHKNTDMRFTTSTNARCSFITRES